MAAALRKVCRIIHLYGDKQKRILHGGSKFTKYFVLSLGSVKTMTNQQFLNKDTERANIFGTIGSGNQTPYSTSQTFEPNDPRLRSSECLKNAAGLAVDSTSAVLSQTVYAVINIEEQYVELVTLLIALMEHQLQLLGQEVAEQKIADLILETRHKIEDINRRKQELAFLFDSVKKMADATAEVAFAAGATYASTSIGERLHSAVCQVQQVQAVSEEADKKMLSIEVRSIEVISQHEQNQEKHKTTN